MTATKVHDYVDPATFPAYPTVDFDDPEILLAELTRTVANANPHGIRSPERARRITELARVAMLAGRLAALEAGQLDSEQTLLGFGLAADGTTHLNEQQRAEFGARYKALRGID